MSINFSEKYKDYAKFTPAVSEMYARFVTDQKQKPARSTPINYDDLDFLDPNSKLFYIPYALYSAGQAAKTKTKKPKIDMITGRTHGNSTIIGDSGGFQIQQGSIKFTGDELKQRMLNWLETNCNWSMILDFPTGGINMGTVVPHTERLIKEGHDVEGFCRSLGFEPSNQTIGYATCLLQTLINNDFFVQHRKPNATKFLNVIQGRNEIESKTWYEKVKHYPFEGWSLASHHKEKFDMTLSRIINMRDDGLLHNKDWMHFLGVGKLAHGCIYTTIQRVIRNTVNENFSISYDVSSPFTSAAYGNLFLGFTLDKAEWTIQSSKRKKKGEERPMDGFHFLDGQPRGENSFLYEAKKLWDEKVFSPDGEMINTLVKLPDSDDLRYKSRFIESEVGKLLKMKHICVNTDPDYTSTWDIVSYAIMMNHNVQVHLEAVFDAQELYDKGDITRVPTDVLMLKEIVEEILDPDCKDPYQLINKNRRILNCLAGQNANGGVIALEHFDLPNVKEHNESIEKIKSHISTKNVDMNIIDDLFQGL